MNTTEHDLISVKITDVRDAARDIKIFRLQATAEAPLPAATAGSHIDVHLANGLIRQYSLVIKQPNEQDYVIAVKRDAASRGGSTFLCSNLKAGDVLRISAPRNHFPLNETATHSVLIAGGIGITPIFSMVCRLVELGKPWMLHYAVRTRADMVFFEELSSYPSVNRHFDDERAGAFLEVGTIVRQAPPGAHFYCCGPAPLMASFEAAAETIPAENKHVEYFSAKEGPALEGGFTVRLAKSGKVLSVPPGRSILDVVTEAGVAVDRSCTEGICGTCETKVLAGTPDHRDSILSPAERESNRVMMICCSGAKSDELVLDL